MIRSDRAIDRHNVPLYYAYGFFMDVLLWNGIWIKYLIDDRGLELRWILAMDLPFWLLVALLQAPMGALADQLGRRRMLAAGGFTYAVVVLGFGLTTNYLMLFLDYVLWAVAISMRSGKDSALLFDTLKQAGHEERFAKLAGRAVATRFGAMIAGLLLGGLIAEQIGLARTVQLGAVPPLLAGFFALAMREPAVQRAPSAYLEGLREGLAFAWRHAEVRYTVLIGSVLLAGTFGTALLVQPFLIEHDVDTAWYGVYQTPLRLASVIGALSAFWVVRKAPIGQLIVVAPAAIVVCWLGLALSDATPMFAFFLAPALVAGLTEPIVGAHLNPRIPSERRATVLSVMPLLFALQAAFFEPALGFFADGISLHAAFAFAAAYFLVCVPPLALLWRRAHAPAARDALVEPLAR